VITMAAEEALPENAVVLTEEAYEQEQEKQEIVEDEKLASKQIPIPDAPDYDPSQALYLIRDMWLYKNEPIVLIFGSVLSAAMVVFAYLKIIPLELGFLSFGMMLLMTWGVWLIKRQFFLPNKGKRMIARVYQSGQLFITCEKLKEGRVNFGKSSEDAVVTNVVAHTEGYSGQPFILAYEGHYENLNMNRVMKGYINPRSSAKVNAALDKAYDKGVKDQQMMTKLAGQDVTNGTLMLAIGIIGLILIGYIWLIAMPQAETLEAIKKGVEAIPSAIAALPQAAVAAAPPASAQVVVANGS
jgi:hypothetical protein